MIKRDSYLKLLTQSMWNGEIKVITGIRRCGKSTLLFDLFYDQLISEGVKDDHIIKLSLDQRKYYIYRNPVTLCDYIENLLKDRQNEKFYLFIDEVQFTTKVIDKEHGDIEVTIYDMLNELKSYKNLDVYVTGSNSKGLSKDIATEFRDRATQIHVYPLSFEEYYSCVQGDEKKALGDYMLFGGMPRLLELKDEKSKKDYLASLFREVYIKDILERNHLEREDVLDNIIDYLASETGSLSNPTNIANAIASLRKEKANPLLVSNYIQAIADSFLISIAKRYDVKGKKYFDYPYKYYYTDVGLRNARLNYRQFDPGHLMENIIYNDLIRRGFSVDIGVVYDRAHGGKTPREIDFVVNEGDKRCYVQSALRMDEDNKERLEIAPLALTKDFFKKVIIRNDIWHSYYDEVGIYHCSLIDFLLSRVDLFN